MTERKMKRRKWLQPAAGGPRRETELRCSFLRQCHPIRVPLGRLAKRKQARKQGRSCGRWGRVQNWSCPQPQHQPAAGGPRRETELRRSCLRQWHPTRMSLGRLAERNQARMQGRSCGLWGRAHNRQNCQPQHQSAEGSSFLQF